eukprot:Skav220373  [mRNA]  locus=scaffold609:231777:239204:+ [translate_table: standard]
MKVVGSECAKFKAGKCPTLCKDNKTSCEADATKGHKITLKMENPNEMIRSVDNLNTYAVKRSFLPVDAELDAFLCVKVNESWVAIRGMSYKQLDSKSQKVKDTEDSKGLKVFESKTFGKKSWKQEEHIMKDGLSQVKDQTNQPPWKRSIQATVEWKKVMQCPPKFPLCYDDGDCVASDCKNGCDWAKAPTVDSNEDMMFNFIAGADTYGTPCDADAEVTQPSAASGLSLAALLVAFVIHIA